MLKKLLLQANRNRGFLNCLGLLWIFHVLAPVAVFPSRLIFAASFVSSVIAISLPILALFEGSKQEWTFTKGTVLLASGVVVQFGCIALAQLILAPYLTLLLPTLALSQVGLVLWCLGLGASISLLVLDKNLILPITIFLALIDIFLVLTPVGLTKQVVEAAPEVLQNVGLSVPKPSAAAQTGRIVQLANVGPADLIFVSMFFAALLRFQVDAKRTLRVLVPTLAGYLLIVVFLGDLKLGRFELSALPALVPIGIVVLIANLKEFKLSRDEKLSTALVLGIAALLIGWGMSHPPRHQPAMDNFGSPDQALPESNR